MPESINRINDPFNGERLVFGVWWYRYWYGLKGGEVLLFCKYLTCLYGVNGDCRGAFLLSIDGTTTDENSCALCNK